MGQRANYVIIENGTWSLWYSHWTANTLTRDLFWGPEWALSFIRRQQPTAEWLDEVWCEGAAVIDLDRKVLLLFGGEDIDMDVPLRNVYLDLLRSVWSGWTVRWAHEGIADVADYVGVSRDVVLAPDEEEDGTCAPPLAGEWIESVVSIRWQDGRLALYPMGWMALDVIAFGPRLVDILRREQARDELTVEAGCSGGMHLDPARHRMDFWISANTPAAMGRASRRWPEWTVTWHRDEFEQHVQWTENRLAIHVASQEQILEQLIQRLVQDEGGSPTELLLEHAERERVEGKRVELNPCALVHAPQEVPAEERHRILQEALSRLRRSPR